MSSSFLTAEAAEDSTEMRLSTAVLCPWSPYPEGACPLTARSHAGTVNLLLFLRSDSSLNTAIRMKKRPSCLGPEENKQTGPVCTPWPRGAILHRVISFSNHSLFPALEGRQGGCDSRILLFLSSRSLLYPYLDPYCPNRDFPHPSEV